MESFDQSLKYLLEHEPADFIRFALNGEPVEVLHPLESALPSRGRDVDGGYLFASGGVQKVAHIEFHRRHQRQDALAIDVAEAQVRLFRRELVEVVSFVWDLYGRAGEPVLSRCVLVFGEQSQSQYRRINLRGMSFRELLAQGPPALWPLSPLTCDGATGEAVQAIRDAIEGRGDLSAVRRADHLAVLWFIAEAENVAVELLRSYIQREKLMQSELYRSIFAEGRLEGRQEGLQTGLQQAIMDLCEVLGIELTPERKAQIEQLDPTQLSQLRTHLKSTRTWLPGT
jgi:predicted transposase YdaD